MASTFRSTSRRPRWARRRASPSQAFDLLPAGDARWVAGRRAPVLGGIEYAVSVLDCPLVVVLGHDSCGAVATTGAALAAGLAGDAAYEKDVAERTKPEYPLRAAASHSPRYRSSPPA
ncbi:hypothetical protein FCH28_13300 [Streptomyces piniterrae]|uniref:Carbonic anhydrase n=1 Tax=Streptomyces piniterrae TaxID=2571125 RepID=A0A4U0NWP4_9ACTN|nr:hypothetical protein FCH28_13300 [Streptomyces piniterrae]